MFEKFWIFVKKMLRQHHDFSSKVFSMPTISKDGFLEPYALNGELRTRKNGFDPDFWSFDFCKGGIPKIPSIGVFEEKIRVPSFWILSFLKFFVCTKGASKFSVSHHLAVNTLVFFKKSSSGRFHHQKIRGRKIFCCSFRTSKNFRDLNIQNFGDTFPMRNFFLQIANIKIFRDTPHFPSQKVPPTKFYCTEIICGLK